MQRKSDQSRHLPIQVEPPPLVQFVLLSMLLHGLLIVLLGTATSGGARRGDGWWGPLDITLRPMSPEGGAGFTLAPGAETMLRGAALLRRLSGAAAGAGCDAEGQGGDTHRAEPVGLREAPAAPAPSEVRDAIPDSFAHASADTRRIAAAARSQRAGGSRQAARFTHGSPTRDVAPQVPESEAAPREVPMPVMAPPERVAPPKDRSAVHTTRRIASTRSTGCATRLHRSKRIRGKRRRPRPVPKMREAP